MVLGNAPRPRRSRLRLAGGLALAGVALAGCAASVAPIAPGTIAVVAAESQYADVVSQVGGRYVSVVAVMNNPNADPHGFEVSPSVAREVARARLVVQNGAGYDDFMRVVEEATPSPRRHVVVAQRVLGLAASIPNPHLWYDPVTMPAVAAAIESDLSRIDPAHRAYFAARLTRFDAAMGELRATIAAFHARYAGRRVATTEPVGDYLLSALGLVNDTPFRFQADVMNGVDPAPQDVGTVETLVTARRVSALLVNAQVSSPVTSTLTGLAESSHVPVVALYETMPRGFDYQRWMRAEIDAIEKALTTGRSTRRLT
ncbi:MAG TPA: zinc ABC transporter substrate-binding protein [Acidimicrobiales bacterium]|nr:MAG: hypothetical protein B7Z69_03650 [Actinobacteria bacterium 21-73-9]HQU25860.1 zinc ABC transporter substrate-binding protein [Acidimicrobiales bacterium]